jgi:perosamine synthetase
VIPLSQPQIGEREIAAVVDVLRSGMLAQGPQVAAFEEEFSAFVGQAECVAVNSGTSALHLGLLAAGIGAGDEVIVPSFTFAATANAVALTGATPVFADVEPDTFTLSADAVRAAITERTAAVMPVHLYGQMADMTAFEKLASDRGLLLVEDAAQAHLAEWNGRPAGSFGLGMFSFYPTKNMTSGEGGMITTSDPAVARRARLLRNQGMEQRYVNELVGFNCRMTDLHAAIGRVQLGDLPERTRRRREIAARYNTAITSVTPPAVRESAHHVYHQYTVMTDRRDEFAAHLAQAGVGHGVYYPTPVHRLPSFGLELHLEHTEHIASTVLSLPVHPGLGDDQVDAVIEAVNSWS